jgi:anti-anti-sigma regulatory factor
MTATAFNAELIRSGSETIIRLRGELEDESAVQARQAFEQALSEPPERLLICPSSSSWGRPASG